MALVATARWKEEVVVEDEERRAFVFDCGWGVDPPIAYVPAVEDWSACVPAWLHDRREEVLQVLLRTSHVVHEGPYPKLESGH